MRLLWCLLLVGCLDFSGNRFAVDLPPVTGSSGTEGSTGEVGVTGVTGSSGPMPTLTLRFPPAVGVTDKASVRVRGSASNLTSLQVNGVTIAVTTEGAFATDVPLAKGANTITVVAADAEGHSVSKQASLRRMPYVWSDASLAAANVSLGSQQVVFFSKWTQALGLANLATGEQQLLAYTSAPVTALSEIGGDSVTYYAMGSELHTLHTDVIDDNLFSTLPSAGKIRSVVRQGPNVFATAGGVYKAVAPTGQLWCDFSSSLQSMSVLGSNLYVVQTNGDVRRCPTAVTGPFNGFAAYVSGGNNTNGPLAPEGSHNVLLEGYGGNLFSIPTGPTTATLLDTLPGEHWTSLVPGPSGNHFLVTHDNGLSVFSEDTVLHTLSPVVDYSLGSGSHFAAVFGAFADAAKHRQIVISVSTLVNVAPMNICSVDALTGDRKALTSPPLLLDSMAAAATGSKIYLSSGLGLFTFDTSNDNVGSVAGTGFNYSESVRPMNAALDEVHGALHVLVTGPTASHVVSVDLISGLRTAIRSPMPLSSGIAYDPSSDRIFYGDNASGTLLAVTRASPLAPAVTIAPSLGTISSIVRESSTNLIVQTPVGAFRVNVLTGSKTPLSTPANEISFGSGKTRPWLLAQGESPDLLIGAYGTFVMVMDTVSGEQVFVTR